MKALELIEQLKALVATHGNAEIDTISDTAVLAHAVYVDGGVRFLIEDAVSVLELAA